MWTVAGHPQPHVRSEIPHGLKQHSQALAGFVPADEEVFRANASAFTAKIQGEWTQFHGKRKS